MRILITRPEEDAEPLVSRLLASGLEPVVSSLLEIALVPGPPLELAGVQTLLATSANGVRAFARRNDRRAIPVYAVGRATAQAARDAGFLRIATASGDVGALADLVERTLDPSRGTLLHIAGTHLAGDLAGRLERAGYRYRREVLYEAKTAERLPQEAARALRGGDGTGVALYSPRTARIFLDLVRSEGLEPCCSRITAFCLSKAVADQCRAVAFREVVVSPQPDGETFIEVMVAAIGNPTS